MKNRLVVLLAVLATSCFHGVELPPDQEVWSYAYPTEVGLNDDLLFGLDNGIKTGTYGQINGLVIVKDDQVAFENYYNGATRQTLYPIGTATFAVTVLALDFFLESGAIASLDDPIYTYLPDYGGLFEQDTLKKLITFRHLISYSSGLFWNEGLGNLSNDLFQMRQTTDWVNFILSKPTEGEAAIGRRYVVNSSAGILLCAIYQHLLGDEPLRDFLHERLLAPIGITKYEWAESPGGVLDGAAGLRLTTMDFARLGYLMEQEGRWKDRQRVISRDWVLDVSSSNFRPDQFLAYGFGWRIFTDYWPVSVIERPAYYLPGESGQNLYVVPDQDMVVAVMADNFYYLNFYNPSFTLFLQINAALTPVTTN